MKRKKKGITFLANTVTDKQNWIVDSEFLKQHSTANKELIDYVEDERIVVTGNGETKLYGYGNISGHVKLNDGDFLPFTLKKVFYFPTSNVNLIAVKHLPEDMQFCFRRKDDFIVDNETIITVDDRSKTGLYEIQILSTKAFLISP